MISVLKPTIDEKTKKELLKVLDSGWWGQGPKTLEFEEKFAKYVGSKYAVGTNSGTSALDLALKAHEIRGGELITTPITFVADAIVGEWNGMDVTFADIDEQTFCLDPKSVVITSKTRAIITVDSHGRLADIDGIRRKFKGLIIEDAAHAMYTPGAGKKADITIWSFQAVKTMPAGDGGMITTNSKKIYERLRTLTWVGVEKTTYQRVGKKEYTWDYDIKRGDGIKGYMNDITAVICLGQLRRIEKMNAKRRAIQARYNKGFKDVKEIIIPVFSYTVQYYTMKCKDRDKLSDFLSQKGISTSVHFKPLSEMTYWKKAVKRPLPVTNRVWKLFLSLPVHDALTDPEAKYIINSVREFYGYKKIA